MLSIGLGSGYLKLRSVFLGVCFVKICEVMGITFFDTAQQYGGGKGEFILGKSLNNNSKIITKIGLNYQISVRTPSNIRWGEIYSPFNLNGEFEKSIKRLNSKRCFGLLLHCLSKDFDFNEHILILQNLKIQQKVERIGFSIDDIADFPEDSSWADIIEIPAKLLSQVSVLEHQIVIVNGIFRDKDGFIHLRKFMALNSKNEIVALIGSKNPYRILRCYKALRSLRDNEEYYLH